MKRNPGLTSKLYVITLALLGKIRTVLKMPRLRRRPLGSYNPVFAEPQLSETDHQCVQDFAYLYYEQLKEGRGLHTVILSWMGYPMFKCPMDLWIFQEIMVMHHPEIVIEIGTYRGGSALFLANVLDLIGSGIVVTVDIDNSLQSLRPAHKRIQYIHGSSLDPEVFDRISKLARGKRNPLVILDGDHHCEHVLQELRLYQSLIEPDGYLIVEDTNVNGHPAFINHGPGPWEAVDAFLAEGTDFVPDRSCERFLLTMNPRGYLRRKAAT